MWHIATLTSIGPYLYFPHLFLSSYSFTFYPNFHSALSLFSTLSSLTLFPPISPHFHQFLSLLSTLTFIRPFLPSGFALTIHLPFYRAVPPALSPLHPFPCFDLFPTLTSFLDPICTQSTHNSHQRTRAGAARGRLLRKRVTCSEARPRVIWPRPRNLCSRA